MPQKFKVILTQTAYKALELEAVVRGQNLKTVASSMILQGMSPQARRLLDTLESQAFGALEPQDPKILKLQDIEYHRALKPQDTTALEECGTSTDIDSEGKNKVITTKPSKPSRITPEDAWDRIVKGDKATIEAAGQPAVTQENIQQALQYLLECFNQGKEPTPKEMAAHVGVLPTPLGKGLGRLNVKSRSTSRQGERKRLYPSTLKPIVEKLLAEEQEATMLKSQLDKEGM